MKVVALATIIALVWGSFLPSYTAFAQEGGETPPPQEQTVVETPVEIPAAETQTSSENTGPQDTEQNGENGAPGENGESDTGTDGNEQAAPAEGEGQDGGASDTPAEVDTGNAESVSDSNNQSNTNDVTTGGGNNTDTTVNADNNATTTASTTAEALTGDNAASGGSGNASVNTGDAYASGNAINVVNTNIVDSSGMMLFLNLLFGGGFDFRTLDLSYFFGGGGMAGASGGCNFSTCDGADLNVNTDNTATVLNSVIVRAMTGGNECAGDGDCSINTGDAYASGNAVNLVNSNIINSNYLLVSFNAFGDMANDIILPGADFFSQLLSQNNQLGGALTVNATNTATVTDSTAANADSGNNTATTGDGTASVDTGNAISSATSYNQVNSTLIGGTQVFFLFRIWGDWSGSITGLPEGMQWAETPFGIELFNSDGSAASTASLGNACCGGSDLTVNATNTAQVDNNVEVYALTGDNRAESASSTASVTTGNAYASANSVNIVNTNLIGRNWIFAIFNIFGNFTGNISFGQPDLWIGAVAETGNPTLPGSDITYKFTVSNMGDSDASNVRLTANFAKEMLDFANTEENDTGASWELGSIKKGETREFTYRARAGEVPTGTSVSVPLTASVTARETDSNPSNNTEVLDVVIMSPGTVSHSGPGRGEYSPDPKITMQKVSNVVATSAPALVDYAIIIQNDGGNAYDVKVTDALVGPNGFVGDQSWKLGTVLSGEEVRIEYTVQFGSDITPGMYTNTAVLTGTKNFDVNVYSTTFENVTAENKIEIRPRGEVLGEEIAKLDEAPKCEAYLTDYIRPGRANSSKEVKKLQSFLINHEGESGLSENGRFDNATLNAVKRFQEKYLNEILAPWGIQKPTGSVYYTTKKKINELQCADRNFDLSPDQLNEINQFRVKAPTLPENYNFQNVGGSPDLESTVTKQKPLPALPAIFKMPPPEPKKNESSTLQKFLKGWMVSMVPFVDALER